MYIWTCSRSVPFARTCVQRSLQGCDANDKHVFEKLIGQLMEKVAYYCPEVECDVCGAQKCLDELENMEDVNEYCRYCNPTVVLFDFLQSSLCSD